MSGLIESATAILSVSERRLEVAAHNVANVSTPGYKRRVDFLQLLEGVDRGSAAQPGLVTRHDFAQGALVQTSNPFDLAIGGRGYFQFRAGDAMLYSRQGQFRLAEDGTLVTPQGYVLQQAGGGDLVLEDAGAVVSEDGTVLAAGVPVARIAVFSPSDPDALQPVAQSSFAAGAAAMEPEADSLIRQGMIEGSNVELGDEMVTMMTALRQSEAGARLVQVYDDLLGRAISSLGRGGR